MSAAFKTIFRKIGGRIIPIRQAIAKELPGEIQKIVHIQKARAFLRNTPTDIGDKFAAAFYNISKKQSKEAGMKIGRRIAKIGKIK